MARRSKQHCALAAGALALLAGCTPGAGLRAPAPPEAVQYGAGVPTERTVAAEAPQGEAQYFPVEGTLPQAWWTLFQNSTLSALVEEALAHSPQLAEAQGRLREAQADLEAVSGSTRWPALTASATASRQKVYPGAFGFTQFAQPPPFPLYNASVNASYTLDLFGANRHAIERQQASVSYQHYLLGSARLTLAANVVTGAIRRAATGAEIHALEEALAAQQRALEITAARFAAGGVSALDVQAARSALAQSVATLAPLRTAEAQLGHELAVLLGRAPGGAPLPQISFEDLALPETVPVALPSTLARRRPDIAAAEAQLAEAGAAVGVATANLYPQFSVSASLGSERTSTGTLSDGFNVWSLGGNLMQPLWRGGALRAQRRSAVAAWDAAAASYQQAVLGGLQQVADALRALEHDAETLQARADAELQARDGLAIARAQYQAGGISELSLRAAERSLAEASSARIGAAADRLADTAALLHALGGDSWVAAAP